MHETITPEQMQELCICTNLRRATRLITREYDKAYAGTGIRSTQAPILTALMVHGKLSMTHLAETLGLDNSTLSRNFRILEEGGLVKRTALDGRTFGAEITEAGVQQMKAVSERWHKIQQQFVAALGGDKRWADLRQALSLLDTTAEPS